MKRIFVFFILFIVIVLFYLAFNNSLALYSTILETLNIWLMKVFPSLFTFFIVSSLLINFKIINYLSFLFKPLKRILNFYNDEAFNIFLLSIFNGNPSTILFINQSLESNKITIDEANVLTCSASFISPFFILSFFDKRQALLLIISHVLANFILVFFLNRRLVKKNISIQKDLNIDFDGFLSSINKAISVLLVIAGTMVSATLLKYALMNSLSFLPDNLLKIVLSFSEVSTGLNDLRNLNINSTYILLLSSFLLGMGGFCIHLQVASVLSKKISYKYYLKGRFIQGIISVVIVLIIIFVKKIAS